MAAGRSQKGVRLRQFGLEVEYEVLATNQFSSERKRMSVLVRTPAGKVVLFCKGADEVMLPLLTDKEEVRHNASQPASRCDRSIVGRTWPH